MNTPLLPHEKLKTYGRMAAFSRDVRPVVASWPSYLSLQDQFLRALESSLFNLADAVAKNSIGAKRYAGHVVIGSIYECGACMDLADRWGLAGDHAAWKEELGHVARMTHGLVRSWERQGNSVREADVSYAVTKKPIFSFEELKVYGLSLTLAEHVVRVADSLDRSTVRNLESLSTRIVLNIAEGNAFSLDGGQRRHLEIAAASALRLSVHMDLLSLEQSALRTSVKEDLHDLIPALYALSHRERT